MTQPQKHFVFITQTKDCKTKQLRMCSSDFVFGCCCWLDYLSQCSSAGSSLEKQAKYGLARSMSNFGAKLHGEAMLVKVERDVLRAAPGQGNRSAAAVAGLQHVSDQFRREAEQFIHERQSLRRMAGLGSSDGTTAAIEW
eukprot:s4362_g10.t1